MNVLDENIPEQQRTLLLSWHVPFRQIGYEVGRKGIGDDEIIWADLVGKTYPSAVHEEESAYVTGWPEHEEA